MFRKGTKILFGTMYPNKKIAIVTDLETGKKTMYKLREVTHRDNIVHNLERVHICGKEYVVTE